jgi:hypothetical protein
MPVIYENLKFISQTMAGHYFRLDGRHDLLSRPPCKRHCFLITRVWLDGINYKRHGDNTPGTDFIGLARYKQRVEVFTREEFLKLAEDENEKTDPN